MGTGTHEHRPTEAERAEALLSLAEDLQGLADKARRIAGERLAGMRADTTRPTPEERAKFERDIARFDDGVAS